MQCEQCRKIVPNEDIKMMPTQTFIAVCNICRGEESKIANPIKRIDELPERRLFYCDTCKYKFRHNPKSTVKLYCPWCGDQNHASLLE